MGKCDKKVLLRIRFNYVPMEYKTNLSKLMKTNLEQWERRVSIGEETPSNAIVHFRDAHMY